MAAGFETALENTSEVQLTTTGRVTGKQTSRPVWFVRKSGKLYLVPVTGSASQWYKNVVNRPAISLAAGDRRSSATATPVTDPGVVADVVDGLRDKYGAQQVAAYYPHPDVAVEVTSGDG